MPLSTIFQLYWGSSYNILVVIRQLRITKLYWSLIYTYLANKCLSLLRIMSLIPAHEKMYSILPRDACLGESWTCCLCLGLFVIMTVSTFKTAVIQYVFETILFKFSLSCIIVCDHVTSKPSMFDWSRVVLGIKDIQRFSNKNIDIWFSVSVW